MNKTILPEKPRQTLRQKNVRNLVINQEKLTKRENKFIFLYWVLLNVLIITVEFKLNSLLLTQKKQRSNFCCG